jgi:hypothetical protein
MFWGAIFLRLKIQSDLQLSGELVTFILICRLCCDRAVVRQKSADMMLKPDLTQE